MTSLATRTYGDDGPRVVFLHGLFGQGRNFSTLAGRLAATGRRVTVLDLPNHGHSPWTDTQDYGAMAEAVAAVLDALDEPVTLVGHSMGGKTAMTLALRRPELLTGLVVVDIAPVDYPTDRPGSPFERYVTAMRSVDLDTLGSRAGADAVLAPVEPDPGVRAFLLQNLERSSDGWRWRLNLAVLARDLPGLVRFPDSDGRYDGPVLWIAGADSGYVREPDRPRMVQLFPRVRLVRVKGAGHWVHAEQPEVFLETVRRFLDAVAPGTVNRATQ